MNRYILFLLLMLSVVGHASKRDSPDSAAKLLPVLWNEREFTQLDVRSGLSENRIRETLLMQDGRMAFATSSTVEVYDGSRFTHFELPPSDAIPLAAYHGYRRLMEDADGRLWLKNSGTLHVIDTQKGLLLADVSKLISTDARLADVYVSPECPVMFVEEEGWLTVDHRRVANLKANGCGVPETIVASKDRLFLCYETGCVCELDAQSGAIVMSSNPFPQQVADSLWAGIRVAMHDGQLWVSHNYRDYERSGFITRLDTFTRQWQSTLSAGMRISDFCFHNDTLWVVGRHGINRYDDGLRLIDRTDSLAPIDNIVFDHYGALWLGTHEKGVLYSNVARSHIITTTSTPYPYRLNGRYCSPRAEQLAKELADGITNCSTEDQRGYAFIGTRRGLMVVDGSDRVVATLDGRDGFPDDNVQSVLVDADGDVWLSTSTGISRIHFTGRDSMEIAHFNILDGLQLNGGEFLPERICHDSTGVICVGFSSGTCYLSPQKAIAPRYTYTFPRQPDATTPQRPNSQLWMWILAIFLILAAAILVLYLKRKSTKNIVSNDDIRQQNRDYIMQAGQNVELVSSEDANAADATFMDKLRKVVEENIATGDALTVQTLSELMAMDRTGLYRRMQQLTGLSPSAYIKNIRMMIAARLLQETDLSVSDIATRTGFSSSRYFQKVFKDTFDVSPAAYRRILPPLGGSQRRGDRKLM